MTNIDIMLNGSLAVGSIQFTHPDQFPAVRTLSGIRLQIPALLNFQHPIKPDTPLQLDNLRVVVSIGGGTPTGMEIGTARYEPSLTAGHRNTAVMFAMDLTIGALAAYERIRNGTGAEFRLALAGDLRFLFPTGNAHHQVASTACTFHNTGQITYSKECWTKMLRAISFRDSVLIEIPYASKPANEWESVWSALNDARDAFDSGGTTGWKNAITCARLALECWADLEKVDHGAGWKAPSMEERKQRTKEQRIDNVRWHLYQLAHDSAHSGADKWTREDAVLMLSTLSALLSIRNP